MNAEALAEAFHKAWESLAPAYLGEPISRAVVPWDQMPDDHRRLMIAAAESVIEEFEYLERAVDVPDVLRRVRDDTLLAELERRAADGHPLLASCPDCTRTDAIVCIHCGDHGGGLMPGVFMFPLETRRRAQLDLKLRKLLAELDSHGVDLFELDSFKQRALSS